MWPLQVDLSCENLYSGQAHGCLWGDSRLCCCCSSKGWILGSRLRKEFIISLIRTRTASFISTFFCGVRAHWIPRTYCRVCGSAILDFSFRRPRETRPNTHRVFFSTFFCDVRAHWNPRTYCRVCGSAILDFFSIALAKHERTRTASFFHILWRPLALNSPNLLRIEKRNKHHLKTVTWEQFVRSHFIKKKHWICNRKVLLLNFDKTHLICMELWRF